MEPSLDLNLLPLGRAASTDQPGMAGLYVAAPPRRPARGRHADQLIFHLALAGNAPLAPEYQREILSMLAKKYYGVSGTVTAAQRAVAEDLNQYLLDRNLRNASSGHQAVGIFTQIVLREGRVSIAQSGTGHLFILASTGAQHLYDPQLAGRGLGGSRTITVRFSQVDLKPNDVLLLTPEPPPSWTETALQTIHRQGAESLRRYLLNQTMPEVSALFIQAQPGKGTIRLPHATRTPRPTKAPSEPARVPAEAAPLPPPPYHPETQRTAPPQQAPIGLTPPVTRAVPLEEPASSSAPTRATRLSRAGRRQAARQARLKPEVKGPAPAPKEAQVKTMPVKVRAPRRRLNLGPLGRFLAFIGRFLSGIFRQIGRGLLLLGQRVLPDESLFTIPASTMIFVAIAVPVVLVAVSSAVYFQRGLGSQYQGYYDKAQETASQADSLSDPRELRSAWNEVLKQLDEAEVYRTTVESRALRAQAQGVLDSLDYVERLDFHPALTSSLGKNAHISRMVATDTDLYMLSSTEGLVLRAAFTSQGYQLDQTFECGPGDYGGMIVGAIVAIAPLPAGDESGASLLATDAQGNLLYCLAGESPAAKVMSTTGSDWGPPQAMTIDSGDLYVLDPKNNAVWIYRDMNVVEQPHLFFDEQIPPMQDVIDLAVNRDDLYLLHSDGHITKCVYSGISTSPTRCEDPVNYTDPRPGGINGPLVAGGHFTEIVFMPPPDPSLYLLEPASQAVYRFGVGLTFHSQYRPSDELVGGPATAFAFSRGNRTVFWGVGNQVYMASLP